MKRSDLKLGETYAYRRGSYGVLIKAEVLTLDPLVSTTVPRYSYKPLPQHEITLPDGSTVTAPAEPPKSSSKPSDLRVLVRVTWSDDDGEESEVRLVAAREILGLYADVVAQEEAARERDRRRARAEAEAARRRKERVESIAARLEAAVPGATFRAVHGDAHLPLDDLEALLTRAGV